ncbi:hypothetical protein F4692_002514 [Nocardioides cavernae]|uniref:Htaa domain-containing protein n=1 Tax=Nocardioides cavernae TaxID=1921566 RepID=A0A7Y9H4A0_9ACTN|nr:hypothetical protein [Nocardioides cavernae]NYE37381.1 hypothetical protein [Nocardioides cavernae]
MLTRTRPARPARPAAIVAACALALAAPLTVAVPAGAAARVAVSNDRGIAVADSASTTSLTVRGSGFQSVKGGFGGVYVAFGWVRDPAGGGWRPSAGGVTGRDYRYVPDSESEDNAGYLRFVSFPGGSTAGEAQAVMSDDGSFSVPLTVPGPTFEAVDRDGNAVQVDCRSVTCGVITFGAHGVKNARNETFTPVRFAEPAGAPSTPAPQDDDAVTPSAETTSTPAPSARDGAGAGTDARRTTAARGRPRVLTERQTARAGQALAFTGRGFEPGEQVLALLDDGVVALGPLVAGAAGDVAGVMALPVDLRVGTHQLRLVGAASGARPAERFPVRAATITTTDAAAPDTEPAAAPAGRGVAAAFVAVAAIALLASLVLLVVRLRRRVRRPAVQEAVA